MIPLGLYDLMGRPPLKVTIEEKFNFFATYPFRHCPRCGRESCGCYCTEGPENE